MSSLLLSLREYSSHTRAFVSTDTNCSSRALLQFSNFQQILVRAEKVQPGRREEAEEEDWREEEEDAADEERDAAAGVV